MFILGDTCSRGSAAGRRLLGPGVQRRASGRGCFWKCREKVQVAASCCRRPGGPSIRDSQDEAPAPFLYFPSPVPSAGRNRKHARIQTWFAVPYSQNQSTAESGGFGAAS